MEKKKDIIDLVEIYNLLKAKKRVFYMVLPIAFALSCLLIFPEPRYYKSNVVLAPEMSGEDVAGGLASVASQFGVNLSGASNDAIYPLLYPEVVESNKFIVGLLDVNVKTIDGTINTDYYTYMSKYQKNNWLLSPFKKIFSTIGSLFIKKDSVSNQNSKMKMNSFMMSKKDYELVELLKQKIICNVDKKTEVITISVTDQDPLISATMADSVSTHLQQFITKYRTTKARIDVEHYQKLANEAKVAYDKSVRIYSTYCDTNQDVMLQSFISKRDEMENEMQLKFNTYSAICTQLETMRAKLQEKTPAFTTLQSASVPVKPAGPKRVFFVIGMTLLTFIVTALWLSRKQIFFSQK